MAQFLGLTLWFSATAAAPAIAAELSLTSSGTAWLTMAVQGGFVLGTLLSALLNLADASGALGCVIAGRWADAWGKARVAGLAMVVSAACAASTALVYGAPLTWLFLLAVVWGFKSSS